MITDVCCCLDKRKEKVKIHIHRSLENILERGKTISNNVNYGMIKFSLIALLFKSREKKILLHNREHYSMDINNKRKIQTCERLT